MSIRIWRKQVRIIYGTVLLKLIKYRTQILLRIQNLKHLDGNMNLLLEKDCKNHTRKEVNYPCIGHKAADWAAPCIKVLILSPT